MTRIEYLLQNYGSSHQNKLNKLIHWFCIPLILFTIIGMLMLIPIPFINVSEIINVGTIILLLAVIYYIRLSISLTIGFILVFGMIIIINNWLNDYCISHEYNTFYALLSIFVLAWIGQFYGHKIEGKKPSFLHDIQYLLVGPMWLLNFIYKKLNIPT
ncbi:MAG: Mpo1-like protein [Saprospiraceae bacterium]